MKPKTARRFLARNQWKIARHIVDEDFQNAFMRHVRKCKKALNRIKFREFSLK